MIIGWAIWGLYLWLVLIWMMLRWLHQYVLLLLMLLGMIVALWLIHNGSFVIYLRGTYLIVVLVVYNFNLLLEWFLLIRASLDRALHLLRIIIRVLPHLQDLEWVWRSLLMSRFLIVTRRQDYVIVWGSLVVLGCWPLTVCKLCLSLDYLTIGVKHIGVIFLILWWVHWVPACILILGLLIL